MHKGVGRTPGPRVGAIMTDMAEEIRAYEEMRGELEAEHLREWALVFRGDLIGTYESFEAAADVATQRFGRGPYLIREIGGRRPVLPASVMYRAVHA